MKKRINLSIKKRTKKSNNISLSFQNTINKANEVLKNNSLFGVDFVGL